MLRLPVLTFQLSKSLPSTSSNLHKTVRTGFKQATTHNYTIGHRALATMSTQSKACCTVPPVVSDGYKEKGEWITINGMKTYATGPKEAKSALLVVYDIFGFFPQTLQGADILAHSDKDHQYQVFMPGEHYSLKSFQRITRADTSTQTSSMASPLTSLGTLRTTTTRARSSASSSTPRPPLPRLLSASPRSLKRSKASAPASRSGVWSATAGEARL